MTGSANLPVLVRADFDVCEALAESWMPLAAEEQEGLAVMVEAACAEVGIVLTRIDGLRWEAVTLAERPLFEKAKALAFDRAGVAYVWRRRNGMVRASDDTRTG